MLAILTSMYSGD